MERVPEQPWRALPASLTALQTLSGRVRGICEDGSLFERDLPAREPSSAVHDLRPTAGGGGVMGGGGSPAVLVYAIAHRPNCC